MPRYPFSHHARTLGAASDSKSWECGAYVSEINVILVTLLHITRNYNWVFAYPGSSAPHAFEPRADIHGLHSRFSRRTSLARSGWPCALLEMLSDGVRNKPRAYRVHMPVAVATLLIRKETLRHDHVQMVLGARHRDIK